MAHRRKRARGRILNAAPRVFGPAAPPERAACAYGLFVMLVLLGAISLGRAPKAEAASVPTGTSPTDTVVRPDGSAAYVLNSGNSTLTVVDPATNLPVVTIPLGQPVNTCRDVDWHQPTLRVLVGCTNGIVLSVDPATSIVVVAINNPLANYSVLSADNFLAGVLGWSADPMSGWLHQFAGGLWAPVAAMPFAAPVEVVEKKIVAAAPTLQDGFLLGLGNGGAFATASVEVFDRTLWAANPAVIWAGPVVAGTGIATSTAPDAYVSANSVAGPSYLLRVNLNPILFYGAAVDTYAATLANDVSVAGAFVTTMLTAPPAVGTTIAFYDAGNPAAILKAGTLPLDPTIIGVGGMSTSMGASGTIDDLYVIYADAFINATSETFGNVRSIFVDSPPPTVTAGIEPVVTPTLAGIFDDVARPCHECSGQTPGVTSGPVFGDGYVEPFSHSPGSVQYASGEEVLAVNLFSVPGVGIDTGLTLTYRSRRNYDYRYGNGWFLNQDARLIPQPSSDLAYYDGSGRKDVYFFQSAGLYQAPRHYDTTLLPVTGGTQISDRFGTVSQFDTNGYRTSLSDRYTNSLNYTVASDRLTGISDTLGRNYTLSYDASGHLSSASDFGGRTWAMGYDYQGNLRKITTPATTQFPSGRTRWFSYQPNSTTYSRGNLSKVWDSTGKQIQTLEYDGNDLAVGENVLGGAYSFAYNGSANTRTVVNRSGNTTTWTFDSTTAMVSQVEQFTRGLRAGEPASYVTTYTIGSNGYVSNVVGPRGNRVDFAYDASLNVTEVRARVANTGTNASTDLVNSFAYGAYAQLTQHTDPLGNVTAYTVDPSGNTTAVTRPTVTVPATQSISETMAYDTRGRLTLATDAESREVSLAYYTTGSHAGYLKEIKRDPSGLALTTTLDYDQFGNVTSITDPRGATTTLTVDEENFVTQVDSPGTFGYQGKFTYDANRSVTKVETKNIDKDGNVDATTPWIDTTIAYDVGGRATSVVKRLTASLTATTSYEYEGSGLVSKVTTPEGTQQTITYDERQLPFQITRGYGTSYATTVQIDYDLNGQKSKFTDARGKETLYTHDLFGRTDSVTNPLGNYATVAYDKAGNVTGTSAYDASSVAVATRANYFDEVNRLWKVVEARFGGGLTPSYPTTTITRDKTGRVVQVVDPLSNATTKAYDAAGRVTSVTDAANNQTTIDYDDNGNVIRTSSTEVATGSTSETFVAEYVYDALNRLTTRNEIDRTNSSNVLSTTFQYDSRGSLVFRVDAEGHPIRWNYDLAGRLVKRERALSTGTTIEDFVTKIEENFTYDKDSRLTALTDDNYQATSYDIDALNRATKTTYADSKYVTVTYDANDNVATWTDQNGTVVTNTYDDNDRLTGRSVSRGTGVQGTTSETYTYDALDRVATAIDDDFQVENTWDSVGNLLKEKEGYTAAGNEKWKSVLKTYSDAGALVKTLYPSAFSVSNTRDAIYRMTALVDDNATANIATFTFQGASRLLKTTNQNGTTTDYTYDGFARVSTIDHVLAGGGSLHKFEYAYDKAHNRRMEKNTFDATWVATLPTAVQTFLNGRGGKGDVHAYDMAYRLVDARYDVTNPATEVANPGTQAYVTGVQYTLDGLGNRSQVATVVPANSPTTTTVSYSTDVVNQYTQVGSTTRGHDNNGNVADDGTHLFKYDYRNHLTEVKLKSSGASIATYRYDAFGRRVEKAVAGAATTRYVLSGQQVIEEYDGSNAWQAEYMYEDGIDCPRAMDRADVADVNGNSNTAEVLRFTYHQSAIGNVTELSQPTGAVVEWVTYDAYGLPTMRDQQGATIAQSAIGNAYLFAGRELDAECGLYHFRTRTYDPVVGRFLQRDSIGFTSGLSLYEYADSSPTTFIDPLGLETGKVKAARLAYEQADALAERAAEHVTNMKKIVRQLEGDLAAAKGELKTLEDDALHRGYDCVPVYAEGQESRRDALKAKIAELERRLALARAELARAEDEKAKTKQTSDSAKKAWDDAKLRDAADNGSGEKTEGLINKWEGALGKKAPDPQTPEQNKQFEKDALKALGDIAKAGLDKAVGKSFADALVAAGLVGSKVGLFGDGAKDLFSSDDAVAKLFSTGDKAGWGEFSVSAGLTGNLEGKLNLTYGKDVPGVGTFSASFTGTTTGGGEGTLNLGFTFGAGK